MKSKSKLLVLGLGIMGFIYFNVMSCSSKTAEYQKSKADTTQTFVEIVTPLYWQQFGINGNIAVSTIAWRLTKDTFAFDSSGAETLIKKWKRDTLYVFEIHLPKKDTTGGKKDSVLYPLLTSKNILVDYNKNPNKP